MIEFHDHVHHQRSGRPEPHHSWAAERFITWTAWITAATVLFAGAFSYANEREADNAIPIMLAGAFIGATAYLRGKALGRKRAALKNAAIRYDRMLAESFP